ncbi:agamous-like MADS-box protein AGL80 [Vicia villosa]|uniref:agamous-like MADS-box protein AGL80 n=1 Tax=Vicia villosa TaxID=3911 RepID=UPI00273B1762|nr:agamous-like MADS-box protein AGL80 [Vicia villosa]
MTRKKVKLAFIENDKARKLAYNKRKKSLVKKVDEISTLCGIDACSIIYGPYDPQPEIWPSPSGVEKVLLKFKTAPEFEQSRRMVNQESFLRQRISKGEKQLQNLWRDNRENETTMLMFQCLNAGKVVQKDVSMAGLNDLAWMIDQNLKKIGRRLESSDSDNNIHSNQSEIQPLPFTDLTNANGDETMSLPIGNDDENLENEFWSNLQR